MADSNFNDEQPLAGHQTVKNGESDSDSEDNHYETSMDKLFATFTSVKDSFDSSRSNSEVDTEEMEEEREEENEGEEDLDSEEARPLDDEPLDRYISPSGMPEQKHIKAVIVEADDDSDSDEGEEKAEYHDNSFWQSPQISNIDDILEGNDYII